MTKPDDTLIPPVKAGPKTSEFALTVVTSLFALLAAFGVIGPNWAHMHEQAVQSMAFLASALAPAAYSISRGLTKRSHQLAVASVMQKAVTAGTISVRARPATAPPAPPADITVTAPAAPTAASPPIADTPSL